MNALQEEITQKTLALCVETGKITAQLLQQAMKKVLADMEKHKNDPRLHHGKQTIRQLIPGRYLVFGDRKDLAELKAAELTPLTAVLKEHDAKIREKQRAVTADDPAYIISGGAFRMLVGDIFDLLAQYSFLRNRVVEVKTEKRLARLQKNLSGENPSIRRMYRRWGFAEDQVVTCYQPCHGPAGAADLSHADGGVGAEIDGDCKGRR